MCVRKTEDVEWEKDREYKTGEYEEEKLKTSHTHIHSAKKNSEYSISKLNSEIFKKNKSPDKVGFIPEL